MQTYEKLGCEIIGNVLGIKNDLLKLNFGPLSINYFSYTFSCVGLSYRGNELDLYLKIPAEDLRLRSKDVDSIQEADRQLARNEVQSLIFLNEKWIPIDGVSWVEFIGFSELHNAILTRRIYGVEAIDCLRKWDYLRRIGCIGDADRLNNFMRRLGRGFGKFHSDNSIKKGFSYREIKTKLRLYIGRIDIADRNKRLYISLINMINNIPDKDWVGTAAPTLKGVDIRNIMLDKDKNIFLLDPGRLKLTNLESDLARLIMTYRIIFWGKFIFPLIRCPSYNAEREFLNGYTKSGNLINQNLFHLLLLKEMLKHWDTANKSLQLKQWPKFIKQFLRLIYIDIFYNNQVNGQLKKIIYE